MISTKLQYTRADDISTMDRDRGSVPARVPAVPSHFYGSSIKANSVERSCTLHMTFIVWWWQHDEHPARPVQLAVASLTLDVLSRCSLLPFSRLLPALAMTDAAAGLVTLRHLTHERGAGRGEKYKYINN